MNNDNLDKLRELLELVFTYAKQNDLPSPIDLAQLGNLIRFYDNEFSTQQYGHEKLRPLLEQLPDIIDIIKDDSISPPRFFANYSGTSSANAKAESPISKPIKSTINRNIIPKTISDFVLIINTRWKELADFALDENWGGDNLPLLRSYIKYTFFRLVSEDKNKVMIADDHGTAAFNTGLVDRKYQPIYALLKANIKPSSTVPWFLESFCVAGENFNGKALVMTFRPLPEAAYYFNDQSDAFYDINAQVYPDWEHIIEENADRIPPDLLERTTHGFDVKSCDKMNDHQIEEYKKELCTYLKNDSFAYRTLIGSFEQGLELAKKKVRWNYKTAIPVYFPAKNSISLLLPLCLISEDRVDLALVVEKTKSGNYQGHTVYPLSWAYANSRLIARPDSEWLQAEKIVDNYDDHTEEKADLT